MATEYPEYNLDDDDVMVHGDPNMTFPSFPSGNTPDLDSLSTSTNDMGDDDLIVSKENGGSAWVKKTAVRLWNYIKTKLGISAQGSTGKYLDEQGNFTTPPNTNNAVTQTISSSDNANYRVLLSGTADDTTRTEGARKDVDLYYNPSTNTLKVGKIDNAAVVNFTSGDSTDTNATSWTSVTKVDDNLSLATLFNRVTTMMKNVRYLYKHSPRVVDDYTKTISLTCSAGWTYNYSLGITLTSGLYLIFITCGSLKEADTQLAFDITNFLGLGFDKSNANYPTFTICSYGRIGSDNTALKANIWSTHARSNLSVVFRFIRLSKII